MKIIGITGGVGAGKSSILAYLEEAHGAIVIEADKVGHLLMAPGGACYNKIIEVFGRDLLGADQTIDRAKLGAIVFCNEERLGCLNKIVHPQVKQWIKNKIEEERLKGECTLFVIEAALLIEDHYDEICDELWYIHTDEGIRRKRLKESRGYSDEKIAGIMANQLSPEKFRKACQAVIVNNGLLEDTYQQIDKQLG